MISETKIVMTTCYDATFAKICAQTGVIDYLLVGDTMGMVIYGHENTLSVSIRQMMEHVGAVKIGVAKAGTKKPPMIIADMPIGTYDNPEQAVDSAKILVEAGADMLKVEGPVLDVVAALDGAGYHVCCHIGLTPQTILDYKLQGQTPEEATRLFREAKELEIAGCQLLVLEMIPSALAKQITEELQHPTIGIGAGPDTLGQVLVLYDLLGLDESFKPRFLKHFSQGQRWVEDALVHYAAEVREGKYPSRDHTFH